MTKSNVMQPYWPWCRKEAAPGPQFFPVDEKLSISVAAVMGLQHALAMCGGIIVSASQRRYSHTCLLLQPATAGDMVFMPVPLHRPACSSVFAKAYTFLSMHGYTAHGCPRSLLLDLAAASTRGALLSTQCSRACCCCCCCHGGVLSARLTPL